MERHFSPKIFKEDCRINWKQEGEKVYNHIRGLSPYPGAWTMLVNKQTGKKLNLKLFETNFVSGSHNESIGDLKTDKNTISVAVKDGSIFIKVLQLEGKKRLKAEELLRGYSIDNQFVE